MSVCHCLHLSWNLLMHFKLQSKYLSNQSMHPSLNWSGGLAISLPLFFFSKRANQLLTKIYHLLIIYHLNSWYGQLIENRVFFSFQSWTRTNSSVFSDNVGISMFNSNQVYVKHFGDSSRHILCFLFLSFPFLLVCWLVV